MLDRIGFRTIRSPHDVALTQVIGIYEASFPKSERKPSACLCEMTQRADYQILIAEIEMTVVGFAVIFIPESIDHAALLEYLAVDTAHRNSGIGRDLLTFSLALTQSQPLLVEVESASDAICIRRRDFYRRNGFSTLADFPYRCPLPSAPPMQLMVANASLPVPHADLNRWVDHIFARVYPAYR